MSGSTNTFKLTDATEALSDPRIDRPTKLRRLQGWRGNELACALRAGNARRLAPATCSALAMAVVVTGSATLAAFTAVTAVFGAVASNHPIESAYNWLAVRTVRSPIPSNRAAKRLGCALGALFFAVSAVGFAVGVTLVGIVPAVIMAGLAAFVALSDICVPSLMFNVLWGSERASADSLVPALRRFLPFQPSD